MVLPDCWTCAVGAGRKSCVPGCRNAPDFRESVQVVAMDVFAGCATAVDQVLPQATKVMDPFHVVHLAADKLDLLPSTPAR